MDHDSALKRWCYDGEELLAGIAIDGGAVGVTSHRVLVLTPDGPGARLQAVHRPNVRGVDVVAGGPTDHLARGARAGVTGLILLVAGALVDLGGLVTPIDPPAGVGVGGLLSLVNAFLGALTLLDEALTLLGVLALVPAVASFWWYLREREHVLQVDVAGDDAVTVAVRKGERTVVDRLSQALADEDADSRSAESSSTSVDVQAAPNSA